MKKLFFVIFSISILSLQVSAQENTILSPNNWGININADYGQNVKHKTDYPEYGGGELNIFKAFPVSTNLFSLTAGMSFGINNYSSYWGMNLGIEKPFQIAGAPLYASVYFLGGLELFRKDLMNVYAFGFKGSYVFYSTDKYEFGVSLDIAWYQFPTYDPIKKIVINEFNIAKAGFEFRF